MVYASACTAFTEVIMDGLCECLCSSCRAHLGLPMPRTSVGAPFPNCALALHLLLPSAPVLHRWLVAGEARAGIVLVTACVVSFSPRYSVKVCVL